MWVPRVSARRDHGSRLLRSILVVLASLVVGCSDGGRPTEPVTPGSPAPPWVPSDPSPPPPPPTRPIATITGRIAFASTRDGAPWIYVVDSASVRRLVPGDEPAWSPDGATIAFQSQTGISLIDADGTNERTIRSGGFQPSWSPDGRQIAFVDGGIRVMQADGAGERLLVSNAFIQGGDEMYRPDWSTDGQRIAFVRYDCCWMEPVEIYVVGLDGGPPQRVINGVVRGGVTWYVSHWSPAWSPDGRSMALVFNFDVVTIGAGAGASDMKALATSAAWESKLDWSPDGRRLVFSDYDGAKAGRTGPFLGHLRLYVADVASGEVQQLLPEAAAPANPGYWDNHAVWSHAVP